MTGTLGPLSQLTQMPANHAANRFITKIPPTEDYNA